MASGCAASQHRDRAAEPAERLRHFQADRPGADDDEMRRQLGEIEDGFVGEIRTLVEAGDRRHRRRRSGRDDETARADFDIARRPRRCGVLERRVALDDAHAEAGEALGRVDRRDRGDDVVHVIVHLGEIDVDARAPSRRRRRGLRMVRRAWPPPASAFDGTQPVLRQSPPILCFSISTTGTPNAAAAAATDRPPEPAPITQMSGVRISAMRPLTRFHRQ